MSTKFYVYIQRRKDNGVVFYVGKGSGQRFKRRKKSKDWLTVCEQAGGFTSEIYKGDLSEDQALKIESELISNPSPDWRLVNKVINFKKIVLDFEFLNNMFEYDETSETCLRFKRWNRSNINKTARFAGDVAGYISNKSTNPCYYTVKANGQASAVHRIIWTLLKGAIPDGFVVNHKNNNSLDNRIDNLELITQAMNSRRTSLHKLQTTGVGTLIARSRQYVNTYSKCTWTDENGKVHCKLFPHASLGEEEANRQALLLRKQKLQEMEHLGYQQT